ncbi:hypothetical protein Tco_0536173, partial [Tanacetum coccineum]
PAPIPAGRQTRPAPVYAGTPVPAGRQNRPAPVHADRPFPAGKRNSVSVFAGWRNNDARPMSKPTSSYFQNYSRPVYYDQMYMGEGRWGTAVKSLADCLSQKWLGSPNVSNVVVLLKIHTDENVADLLKSCNVEQLLLLVVHGSCCWFDVPTGSFVVPADKLIFLLVSRDIDTVEFKSKVNQSKITFSVSTFFFQTYPPLSSSTSHSVFANQQWRHYTTRMLKHKLELARDVVGNDLTTAEQLIGFIKNQLAAAQVPAA